MCNQQLFEAITRRNRDLGQQLFGLRLLVFLRETPSIIVEKSPSNIRGKVDSARL